MWYTRLPFYNYRHSATDTRSFSSLHNHIRLRHTVPTYFHGRPCQDSLIMINPGRTVHCNTTRPSRHTLHPVHITLKVVKVIEAGDGTLADGIYSVGKDTLLILTILQGGCQGKHAVIGIDKLVQPDISLIDWIFFVIILVYKTGVICTLSIFIPDFLQDFKYILCFLRIIYGQFPFVSCFWNLTHPR